MQPYQERVIEEHKALNKKHCALTKYIGGEGYQKLPAAERERLTAQIKHMTDYLSVLSKRIDAFTDEKTFDEVFTALMSGVQNIRRKAWPEGDYISADGAEEGQLWYYTDATDDFTGNYMMGFHELDATDWEIVQ